MCTSVGPNTKTIEYIWYSLFSLILLFKCVEYLQYSVFNTFPKLTECLFGIHYLVEFYYPDFTDLRWIISIVLLRPGHRGVGGGEEAAVAELALVAGGDGERLEHHHLLRVQGA